MAANIDAYVGRQAGWHKLGTVTGHYMTWLEMVQHGLDFDVFKDVLYDRFGRPVNAWGTYRWNPEDKAADNMEAAIFLGEVGQDYKVMHHSSGFGIVDALMMTQEGAHYETAGALGKGEVVWGLADLKLSMKVGEDEQKGYLLFYTSHDGSKSYGFRLTNVRVVCQNTLDAALSAKTKASFTIRHTKNADNKVRDAKVALSNLGADVKRMEDKLNFLAQRKMTRESSELLFERLFPKVVKERGDGEEVSVSTTRRDNILADILKIYELNDGNVFPEQRGSAYNMLNAVTNYVDHERSSTSNGKGRAESALFGSGLTLKNKALEVLVEQAGTMGRLQTVTVPSGGGGLLDEIMAMS